MSIKQKQFTDIDSSESYAGKLYSYSFLQLFCSLEYIPERLFSAVAVITALPLDEQILSAIDNTNLILAYG